jgi:hypothetical protein
MIPTVVCVLRSGGDYTPEYVDRLYDGVKKHLKQSHLFICVTDLLPWRQDFLIWKWDVPLWKGWWSKIATFFITPPVIYFDLDTIITGPLDPFVDAVMADEGIWMLQAFRYLRGVETDERRWWASGIMGWNGDFQYIADDFRYPEHSKRFVGDQKYIAHKLLQNRVCINPVQDKLTVASYKHHCQNGVPKGTDVVCFHGHPRPHEIGWEM